MLRYKNYATLAIEVDLQSNYSDYSIVAMANWNNDNRIYLCRFFLKKKDIEILNLMEDFNNTKFESDIKTIKQDISTYITDMYNAGFFKHYIERYNYEQDCLNKGNEYYEEERIKNVSQG